MAKQINWIPEKEAAAKLGYKPRTLRVYAKSGKLNISYTSLGGRKFQYDEKSLQKVLTENAFIVH